LKCTFPSPGDQILLMDKVVTKPKGVSWQLKMAASSLPIMQIMGQVKLWLIY
jgi:hypothetical protein